jgi:hypothetical protein
MKCVATLDFSGINGLYQKFERGKMYNFEDNETTKLLLKVGYIKKIDDLVEVAERVEVKVEREFKEVKEVIETKELKVKKQTKKRNG